MYIYIYYVYIYLYKYIIYIYIYLIWESPMFGQIQQIHENYHRRIWNNQRPGGSFTVQADLIAKSAFHATKYYYIV